MGEEKFFDALWHIMWEMEIDIFTEKEKTLALAADFAPKCRKQYKRLAAMYDCGAMSEIAEAVADKSSYAEHMWNAVDLLAQRLKTDESHAVFSVNQIIALWDGALAELDDSETQGSIDAQGDDEMLFLQDVTDEEEQKQDEQAPEEKSGEAQGSAEEQPEEQGPSLLKRLTEFWCSNDCEDGRPLMIACPIGWVIMLLCAAIGAFMVCDIPHRDKLAAPVFLFMFALLVGKRHYRYGSVGRLSVGMALCYIAAGARALWVGSGTPIRGLLIVLAALVVFNNGRFASLLDGQKRKPWLAYLLMIIMSAAVCAGVFAIQNVEL